MEQEILKCLEALKTGRTILYPTDTIWGIGCDALNPKAVEKVYFLKKRMEDKSLIILLDDPSKLPLYVGNVPLIAWDLIKQVDSPLTIIYPNARNLPENVTGEDNSIAIRIVHDIFCRSLVRAFGRPVISTSANISGEPAPLIFKNISPEIKNGVGYVVNLFQDEFHDVKPSRIIKFNEKGEFRVIRK